MTNFNAIENVELAIMNFGLEFSYSKDLVLSTEAGSDFINTLEEVDLYEKEIKRFMLFQRTITIQRMNDDCIWRAEEVKNILTLN